MKRVHIKIVIGLVAGAFLWGSQVFGDEAKQLADIQSLITALRECIATDRGPSDTSRSPLLRNTPELETALSAYGELAIPAIVSALKKEKYPQVVAGFAYTLAQIPGEQSGKALVSLYRSELSFRKALEDALVTHAKIAVSAGSVLSSDETNILYIAT